LAVASGRLGETVRCREHSVRRCCRVPHLRLGFRCGEAAATKAECVVGRCHGGMCQVGVRVPKGTRLRLPMRAKSRSY
jgi:hypothetical protein